MRSFLVYALATASVLGAYSRANPIERRAAVTPSVNPTAISLSPAGGGTYPRLAFLGTNILAGFTFFSGTTSTLTITRSTNGGASFSALGSVASASTTTTDLDNLHLVALPNGNLVAAYRNHDRSGGTYSFYRITASISTDGGATWKFLSQIAQRAASGVNGLWEPHLRISNAGLLQVYYASENAANDQDILMQTSSDNGATWSAAKTVAGGSTTGRDGMPGVAKFTVNGAQNLVCVFETTEGTGTFTVKSVISTDDGATWGSRSQVYVPTGTSNNAGAPDVISKPDGSLVVSFMTDEDTSLHNWVNGADMKILTANAGSPLSWGHKTTVSGVQSSWPSLLALTTGTVLGCADNSGVKCHSISFT